MVHEQVKERATYQKCVLEGIEVDCRTTNIVNLSEKEILIFFVLT